MRFVLAPRGGTDREAEAPSPERPTCGTGVDQRSNAEFPAPPSSPGAEVLHTEPLPCNKPAGHRCHSIILKIEEGWEMKTGPWWGVTCRYSPTAWSSTVGTWWLRGARPGTGQRQSRTPVGMAQASPWRRAGSQWATPGIDVFRVAMFYRGGEKASISVFRPCPKQPSTRMAAVGARSSCSSGSPPRPSWSLALRHGTENRVDWTLLSPPRCRPHGLAGGESDAGVAHWDLLDAMGGLGSMPAWVSSTPPLAGRTTCTSPREEPARSASGSTAHCGPSIGAGNAGETPPP